MANIFSINKTQDAREVKRLNVRKRQRKINEPFTGVLTETVKGNDYKTLNL